MILNCGVREDSWEFPGLQGVPTNPSWRKSVLNIHWKDWCWSWNSNTLATWCEELTHWKRLWCWERLKVEGEGDNRGWDGWMASPIRWTWVWVNSGSWWWPGRPGELPSMGSQRVGCNWVTKLNRDVPKYSYISLSGLRVIPYASFFNCILLASYVYLKWLQTSRTERSHSKRNFITLVHPNWL